MAPVSDGSAESAKYPRARALEFLVAWVVTSLETDPKRTVAEGESRNDTFGTRGPYEGPELPLSQIQDTRVEINP